MFHRRSLTLSILLVALLAPSAVFGDDTQEQAVETRMRQALRDTMLQLRDAQNQAVTLQAAKDQDDKDKVDLQAKVDALTAQLKTSLDQAASDKSAADKAIADLKSQVADQTGQIDRLTDSLKQWKDAYNQAAQLASEKEALRAQLAMQAALLQRTVDDRESKNLALFKIGNDILSRYERFGLGDAIEAKEPFVGLTRVKLENLVQDYKNKLLDQAITSAPPSKDEGPIAPTPELSEPLPTLHPADAPKQTKNNDAPPADRAVNPS